MVEGSLPTVKVVKLLVPSKARDGAGAGAVGAWLGQGTAVGGFR